MESLKLEEEMLEQQLCTYKTQLSVVAETLSKESVGQEHDELLSLKSDLEELITLTQDNLLEVKKQVLLSSFGCSLNEITSESHNVERNDNISESVPSSFEDEPVLTVVDNDGNSGDSDPIIQGMKCRAPFDQELSWRGVSYHNAMILCEEPNEMVRVIFTHPRFDSMKPCSFFLEGNCKFSDDTCRYSHGHIVSIDQLQPFTDPNFSSLHSGSRCVAKHSDGLFHDAVVRHCGDLLTVQFTTFGNKDEIEISIEDIIPSAGSDSSSSSSTDCSSSDADSDGVEEKGNDDVCIIDWIPRNTLGQWEQYTTGIGSKLLAKMGYVTGKGLGRDNQGRVEPVPIEILPSGKSLDVCVAIREERRLKMAAGDNGKKKRKKKIKGRLTNIRSSVNQERSSNKDVFAFLNTRLGQVNNVVKNKRDRNTSQKSENLNIELFKVQETISNLEKKIKVLKSRNNDRKDKRVEEHIEKNVQSVDNKLQHLKKQERLIMNKMKRKSEETKLSVF